MNVYECLVPYFFPDFFDCMSFTILVEAGLISPFDYQLYRSYTQYQKLSISLTLFQSIFHMILNQHK